MDLAHNYDLATVDAIVDQLAAFREGLGPQAGLLLDLNFSMKPEGLVRVAGAVEPFRLTWLEMDVHDPKALAQVRASTSTPIGSLEAIYGRRHYRPYLEQRAVAMMSAHLAAAVPNFRILEIEADDVPWKDALVTRPPLIENGELLLPTGPGWGCDVNEEAVLAHPPKQKR